jgi:integrase
MPDKRRGHNEGSVYYEESRDRWVAAISLENGKRKKAYCKTKQEAIRKKNEMLREAEQGTLPTGPNQKLKDYLPDWLENVQREKLRPNSYIKYKKMIRHIVEELGEIYLTKLTPEQVKRFYTKKLQAGVASKTVHDIHGVLHVALDNAVNWGYIPRNVCDLIDAPRAVSRQGTPLTVEQAKLLLEKIKTHRLEVLITMAIVTGMRRGELLALRWSCVDLNRGLVLVLRTVDNIDEFGYIEDEPKTKSSKRTVYLPPFLIEMLKKHRKDQEALKQRVNQWEEKNLVFPDLHGGYLNPSYMLQMFKGILEDAGLPPMHFHDLRHSAATILLSMGVNVKVIQDLLGHSNVSITLNTYSHLIPSMQQGAAIMMNDVFGQ